MVSIRIFIDLKCNVPLPGPNDEDIKYLRKNLFQIFSSHDQRMTDLFGDLYTTSKKGSFLVNPTKLCSYMDLCDLSTHLIDKYIDIIEQTNDVSYKLLY